MITFLCVLTVLSILSCMYLLLRLERVSNLASDAADEACDARDQAERFAADSGAELVAVNQLYLEMSQMANEVKNAMSPAAYSTYNPTDEEMKSIRDVSEFDRGILFPSTCGFKPTGSPVSPVTPLTGLHFDRLFELRGNPQSEILASVDSAFGGKSPEVTKESNPELYAMLIDALRCGDSLTTAPVDFFGTKQTEEV